MKNAEPNNAEPNNAESNNVEKIRMELSDSETTDEKPLKKVAMTNAEKQKRYRENQKQRGLQEMRGYLSPEAKNCYKLISEQTNWSDSVILSNAVRLTYAAYKNGQIGLLNSWLKNNKL